MAETLSKLSSLVQTQLQGILPSHRVNVRAEPREIPAEARRRWHGGLARLPPAPPRTGTARSGILVSCPSDQRITAMANAARSEFDPGAERPTRRLVPRRLMQPRAILISLCHLVRPTPDSGTVPG